MAQRLHRYADALRDQGAIVTHDVRHAFATIERHRCVEAFYYRGERYEVPQDAAVPDDLLDIVYSDASLLTIMPSRPGEPASSSSAPTIMGPMLEALDLAPGMRVLEIGAGTGYNAALMAAITGGEVVSVEAGADAAAGAAASIRRLGLEHRVQVVHRDGYQGAPSGTGAFDRIIVTVGVAGVPPHWFDQLTDDGLIVAPVAHGGMHPTMEIRPDGAVRPRMWSDFMTAVGPLRPASVSGRQPGAKLSGTANTIPDVVEPLAADTYNDAWFFLGARDRRTTRAYLDGTDPWGGMCAVVEDDTHAAWLRADGSILYTDSATADELAQLITSWDRDGRPILREWRAGLRSAEADEPLLVPADWTH